MTIKKAVYTEHVERYFDCPYCGMLISDNGTASNVDTIVAGLPVICPHCDKIVLVTGGN